MIPQAWKEHVTKNFPRYFAAGFGILVFVLYIQFRVFDGVENRWQDFMFVKASQWGLLKHGDERIVIVSIDDDSIKRIGWPFPRNRHGDVVRKLKKLGAKTIVFDVMFFDPDSRNPDWDKELGRATREAGNVIHLSVFERFDYNDPETGAPMFRRVLREPIPELKKAARLLGVPNVDQAIDQDGHIRKGVLWDDTTTYLGVWYPSMDTSAFSLFTDTPLQEMGQRFPDPWHLPYMNSRPPRDWMIHPGRLKKGEEPTFSYHTYRWISVMDLLEDRLHEDEKKALKGSLALIGSTVLGLFDHYPNPFLPRALGVEHHANNIDNLLHGDHLHFINPLLVVLILLFVVWIPVWLMRLSPAVGAGCTVGLLLGWTGLNFYAFLNLFRIDFIAPAVAMVGSFSVLTVNRIMEEQRQKKFIKGTFGQYLSPKVIDILIKDPSKLKLGGEKRDMSVLFLDIAGFTTISELMTPEGLTEFLNQYLTGLSDVVLKHEGTIDKYIGDCVMAFWNAPLDLKDHRGHAAQAAVECIETIEQLNATKLPKDFPKDKMPEIRVGLNAGFAVVGNMGSIQRLSYTVIGDEVNLASRLEGANKFFHSHIMASESVMEGARDFVEGRELGRVRVVGKKIPIKVFELLGKKGQLDGDMAQFLKAYNEGIEAYGAKKFEEGEKAFGACIKLRPNDGPASLYLRTCRDFSVIPPQSDWDGVWNLTAK